MTKEEALKQFAALGAAWFGNSKQHFSFSAYCRLQGWNKLADKWKEEAEEEWDEAEEVLQRLVELGGYARGWQARLGWRRDEGTGCRPQGSRQGIRRVEEGRRDCFARPLQVGTCKII